MKELDAENVEGREDSLEGGKIVLSKRSCAAKNHEEGRRKIRDESIRCQACYRRQYRILIAWIDRCNIIDGDD
jgi:hypothetical protein